MASAMAAASAASPSGWAVQRPGGGIDNRLVNRQKADWHGPDWMSIPMEKVMFIEAVGARSRLAQLIGSDQGVQP